MKKEKIAPIVLGSLFVGLMIVTFGYRYYQASTGQDFYISQDIKQLARIFADIHETCKILSFEHDKNYIDFLTVSSFAGSEVGLMNLVFPQNWKGPYLNDNPTIQEKYYMIVRTKQGHFIVPGDGGECCKQECVGGVKLANGKVIGLDINFTEESDIPLMMLDPEFLYSKEGALAARISVGDET